MAGDSFELRLRMGAMVAKAVDAEVIDALTSLTVQGASRDRSGFQITFRLDHGGRLERVLLPGGYFDPMIRVIAEVIVRGKSHVIMDGVITQQEVRPAVGGQGATLMITGEDLTAAMDLVDLTGFPFPGMPDVAQVGSVLARYAVLGVLPVVVPPPYIDIPNPLEHIPHQSGTDYQFLRSLADAVGYVFHLEPGPRPGMSRAYWGPEVRQGAVQPALAVDLDADTNVQSLSFRLDGLSRATTVAWMMERRTKVSLPIPLPDILPLRPRLARRPAVPWRVVQHGHAGAATDPIMLTKLAVGRMLRHADAVVGEGSLDVVRYGQVLEPRRLVGVQGAGPAYDGNYYVTRVTHSIQRGAYTQTFSLAREGTGAVEERVTV